MRILSIETSCDETSFALIDTDGETVTVYAHNTLSQIEKHREYGGVFPSLAKREHAINAVPLLEKTLTESGIDHEAVTINGETREHIKHLLVREEGLADKLTTLCDAKGKPQGVDAITVTHGPGLEPALWVGINIAKSLSAIWDVPVIPANHIEGHIASLALTSFTFPFSEPQTNQLAELPFPAITLIVSGGHTELVRVTDWGVYQPLGKTKDDAVGEAFDKVARLLDLPYPGGPEISQLAAEARESGIKADQVLKRPMIDSDDYQFSFSGIKTAVRYRVDEGTPLSQTDKQALAREFEEAVIDVLVHKAQAAIAAYGDNALFVTGGVSANPWLREQCAALKTKQDVAVYMAPPALTGDNALMMALAGFYRAQYAPELVLPDPDEIAAIGNLRLTERIIDKKERT